MRLGEGSAVQEAGRITHSREKERCGPFGRETMDSGAHESAAQAPKSPPQNCQVRSSGCASGVLMMVLKRLPPCSTHFWWSLGTCNAL